MYFHVSSAEDPSTFAGNVSHSFRVKLPRAVYLQPSTNYEIALVDIFTPNLASQYTPAYVTVNTDICDLSIVDNGLQPVLQRLYPDHIGGATEFTNPRYIQLNTEEIDTIHLYLLDDQQASPSFEKGTVYATLHLRTQQAF